MPNLNYKIVGRRHIEGDKENLDFVDVEWTHADGPVEDTVLVPVTHPPAIQYEARSGGKRAVIHDTVSVRAGTPDSVVMQVLEEKRARLAENLGLVP